MKKKSAIQKQIDLVKIIILPISNLKQYCENKSRRQGPKTAGYHRQPATILNSVR